MNTKIIITSVIGFTLLLSACKSESKRTDEHKSNLVKNAKEEADSTGLYTSNDYEFMIPQPFALISSFENADLVYDITHMNPPENVEKYNSEGKKSLNFGVYSTDLVHSIIHDQPQMSMKYFNAIKKMADKIGMGSIFEEESLADSIEKHIADRNVMQELLIDVHERSQDYLVSNDMRMLAAIQFAGAWTEGMYLATRNITPDKLGTLGASVGEHMTLIDSAIKGIEAHTNREEDLDKVLKKMNAIKDKYESFESVESAQGLPKLSMEELKTLQNEFDELRTLITE